MAEPDSVESEAGDGDGATPAGAERRRFTRVGFVELAKLHQAGHMWNVDVLDISLKGVMVSKPVHWSLDPALPCRLKLHLGLDAAVIEMVTRVAYEGERRLGLECVEIDVDSLTHLRQVIAANTGADSAQRELADLVARDA